MNKKIQGRIIRIIDEKTVIINLGGLDGINNNSVFIVQGNAEKIIDPVTKEELGAVIVPKARVKAHQVNERFTIAISEWVETNYITSHRSLLQPLDSIRAAFGIEEETVDQGGKLNVNPAQIEPWKSLSEDVVQVGDVVDVTVVDVTVGEDDPNDNENATDQNP